MGRSPVTISHNEAQSRFECRVDGGLAFTEYIRGAEHITFIHTEVPEEAEGKGVAAEIIAAALAYAREQRLRVVPQCPFVKSYLKRHHEWDDVVDPAYR
jgi:predicted GNAT family acetyltransferase